MDTMTEDALGPVSFVTQVNKPFPPFPVFLRGRPPFPVPEDMVHRDGRDGAGLPHRQRGPLFI
jgi:hypothetical protein